MVRPRLLRGMAASVRRGSAGLSAFSSLVGALLGRQVGLPEREPGQAPGHGQLVRCARLRSGPSRNS
jgi:hypothetical protein